MVFDQSTQWNWTCNFVQDVLYSIDSTSSDVFFFVIEWEQYKFSRIPGQHERNQWLRGH